MLEENVRVFIGSAYLSSSHERRILRFRWRIEVSPPASGVVQEWPTTFEDEEMECAVSLITSVHFLCSAHNDPKPIAMDYDPTKETVNHDLYKFTFWHTSWQITLLTNVSVILRYPLPPSLGASDTLRNRHVDLYSKKNCAVLYSRVYARIITTKLISYEAALYRNSIAFFRSRTCGTIYRRPKEILMIFFSLQILLLYGTCVNYTVGRVWR